MLSNEKTAKSYINKHIWNEFYAIHMKYLLAETSMCSRDKLSLMERYLASLASCRALIIFTIATWACKVERHNVISHALPL